MASQCRSKIHSEYICVSARLARVLAVGPRTRSAMVGDRHVVLPRGASRSVRARRFTSVCLTMRVLSALAALLALALPGHAWYLPGSAPRTYRAGDAVPVQVNALQPMGGPTPVHGLVSYDYYDDRLGFCRPHGTIKAQSGSLGSILFGDRIYNSPLEVREALR